MVILTPVSLEDLHIGHEIQAAHVGAEKSLRADDLEVAPAFGNEFGCGDAGMGAIVVEQEHVFGGLHFARQNIPARDRKLGALLDRLF